MDPNTYVTEQPLTYRIEEDTSNGNRHKRYADERGEFRLVDERCNRDSSGAYAILAESQVREEPRGGLCQYDFPVADVNVGG